MIDTAAVNQNVNLIDLIGKSTRLNKVAANEWAGPCPRCGGKDRLHVNGKRGWFCRRCLGDDRFYDAIAWVRFVTDCGFIEAVKRLGGDTRMTDEELSELREQRRRQDEQRRQTEAAERRRVHAALTSSPDWSTYHQNLDRYPDARVMWNRRGLPDPWIDYYRVGYCPERQFKHNDTHFTSASLTIPYFRPAFSANPQGGDNITWRLVGLQHRLLCPDAPGGKYRPHLAGAGKSLFYTDLTARKLAGRVLVVEGEIKAMVTWAHLWDGEHCMAPDVTVVGTAGASMKAELVEKFAGVEQITICLDPDAEREARRLAADLGVDRCTVLTLPDKIDDLILAGALEPEILVSLLGN